MNALEVLAGLDWWTVAGWTMLHYLWLGLAVGAVAGVLRFLLRRASANVRYGAALVCLAALAALPVGIGVVVGGQRSEVREARNERGAEASAKPPVAVAGRGEEIALGHDGGTFTKPQALGEAIEKGITLEITRGVAPAPQDIEPIAVRSFAQWSEVGALAARWLPWVWIVGAPVTFLLLATGVIGAERLRRESRLLTDGPVLECVERLRSSLAIGRRVAVAVSERVAAPVLVGIVRPLVLLPPAALTGWSPDEIEMVLLHELAHVRRWDNLVNLLQRLVEAALFFQPAVWLVSGWVRREREACCDAVVVGRTQRPQAYAELLVALAAQLPRSVLFHPAAASAMAAGPLRGRIRRILAVEDDPMLISGKSLGVMMSGLLLSATLVVLNLPTRSEAEESDKAQAQTTTQQQVDFSESARNRYGNQEKGNSSDAEETTQLNLKRLVLAMLKYTESKGTLPPQASFDTDGRPLLSWRVHLLPFLGEDKLYNEFRLDEPWNSDHNRRLVKFMPEVFRDPRLRRNNVTCYLAVVGKDCVFNGASLGRDTGEFSDDLLTTIALVEANADRAVEWTKPEDWSFDRRHPTAGLGTNWPGHWYGVQLGGDAQEIDTEMEADNVSELLGPVRDNFSIGPTNPPKTESYVVTDLAAAKSELDRVIEDVQRLRSRSKPFLRHEWKDGGTRLEILAPIEGQEFLREELKDSKAIHPNVEKVVAVKLPAGANQTSSNAEQLIDVVFVRGASRFKDGDSVTIAKVRGTSSTFAPGGTYWIEGTYTLVSRDEASLSAFVTARNAGDGKTSIDKDQTMTVDRGSGKFALKLPMPYEGWPHVSFCPADGGQSFGGEYFGTADSVLKTWWDEKDRTAESTADTELTEPVADRQIGVGGNLPVEVSEEDERRIVAEVLQNPAVRSASIKRAPNDLQMLVTSVEPPPGKKAFLTWKTDSEGRLSCSIEFVVPPKLAEKTQSAERGRAELAPITIAENAKMPRSDEGTRRVTLGIRENQTATAESEPGRLRLQIRTTESAKSKFPTLEEQKLADLAWELLGLELEVIDDAELKRVQALGYEGGLRIAGSRDSMRRSVDFIAPNFAFGEILVGLHAWPTRNLQDVAAVLRRDDLEHLNPLKFYSVRQEAIANENSRGGGRGDQTIWKDRVRSGRLSVLIKSPRENNAGPATTTRSARRARATQAAPHDPQLSASYRNADGQTTAQPSTGLPVPTIPNAVAPKKYTQAAPPIRRVTPEGMVYEAAPPDGFGPRAPALIDPNDVAARPNVATPNIPPPPTIASDAATARPGPPAVIVEPRPTLNSSPKRAADVSETDTRSDLRYDGKTFDQWRTAWQTELSTERRIEAVKALAAFGRAGNGYAKEAAAVILNVAGEYDFTIIENGDDPEGVLKRTVIDVLAPESRRQVMAEFWLPDLAARMEKEPARWKSLAYYLLDQLQAGPDASKTLQSLAKNGPDEVRLAALGALVRSERMASGNGSFSDSTRALLAAALSSNEPMQSPQVLPLLLYHPNIPNWKISRGIAPGIRLNYLPEFVPLLFAADESLRQLARFELSYVQDQDATEILGKLTAVLHDDARTADHVEAIRAIAAMGPAAVAATPELKKIALESKDDDTTIAALVALASINNQEITANLVVGDFSADKILDTLWNPKKSVLATDGEQARLKEIDELRPRLEREAKVMFSPPSFGSGGGFF